MKCLEFSPEKRANIQEIKFLLLDIYNLEVKNDACGVSFIITKNEISIDEENKN